MTSRRAVLAIACIVALSASACTSHVPSSAPAPLAAPPVVKGASPDFDGDGKADLAAGVYADDQYVLTIWYGSGVTTTIKSPDVGGPVLTDPEVGLRGPLAAADFDGDGYDDLAFQNRPSGESAFLIQVFGSPTGLDVSKRHSVELTHPSGTSIVVRAMAMVANPTPRLAVGVIVSSEASSSTAVRVFTLGGAGTPTGDPLVLRVGSAGIPKLTDWSRGTFGDALTSVGNRLFIGVPGAKVSGKSFAGAVVDVTFGAAGVTRATTVTQATAGVTGVPGKTDSFGYSLDAGDGYLVVGTPWDDVGSVRTTGSVQVFRIGPTGLTPLKRLSQAGSAVPGKLERGDLFGWSVELGHVCASVTSVVVGGIGEEIIREHDGDGAVWLIPLTKAKGCAAKQLYEGHGLSGKPHGAYLGEFVAALRDANSGTDTFAFAGGGSWSEGPIGELFRWSPTSGQSFRTDDWPTGLAGRR